MRITININDQESIDALRERVDLFNAGSGTPPITPEQFIEQVHCGDFLRLLVEQKYQASVDRLAKAFRPLPYEQRVATIASLESQTQ